MSDIEKGPVPAIKYGNPRRSTVGTKSFVCSILMIVLNFAGCFYTKEIPSILFFVGTCTSTTALLFISCAYLILYETLSMTMRTYSEPSTPIEYNLFERMCIQCFERGCCCSVILGHSLIICSAIFFLVATGLHMQV